MSTCMHVGSCHEARNVSRFSLVMRRKVRKVWRRTLSNLEREWSCDAIIEYPWPSPGTSREAAPEGMSRKLRMSMCVSERVYNNMFWTRDSWYDMIFTTCHDQQGAKVPHLSTASWVWVNEQLLAAKLVSFVTRQTFTRNDEHHFLVVLSCAGMAETGSDF